MNAPQPLNEWLSHEHNSTRLLFTPEARQSLAAINGIDDRGITILTGPEGGLTNAEQATAEKQGYIPIKLGPRTLRTETAVVAAVTALQVLWGDLR